MSIANTWLPLVEKKCSKVPQSFRPAWALDNQILMSVMFRRQTLEKLSGFFFLKSVRQFLCWKLNLHPV